MDASNILVSLFYSVEEPLGLAPAMRRKQQLEKLQRLNHAAREFARAWRGMHFDVQEEVKRRGTAALDGRDFGFDTEGEWKRFWRTLPHLDRMVGTAVPPARALINAAPEAGKSDMRIIDIIGALRATWAARKGKPAPQNVTEGGAFYKFVDAAFAAMELKNSVRSSMDAWRKFTNKTPEGTRNHAIGCIVIVDYRDKPQKTD